MKILVYSPYLDTLGGGERYFFHVVEFFLKNNNQVDIAWEDKKAIAQAADRFGIDISKSRINKNLYNIFKEGKFISKLIKTINYDLIFFVSDGSVPFLFGKKNIIHFQVPLVEKSKLRLLNFFKFKTISKVVCNSFFTKRIIDRMYNLNSDVLYPPLGKNFHSGQKKNIILSVGRFDNILHSKKQDIMIKVFKELYDARKLKNWQLILAGSCQSKKKEFFNYLKMIAQGYPIKIKENINFDYLQKIYSQAKIYWHITGFGENLHKYPQRAEHFGISVVEAMASGCVPIVYEGGGLTEIVQNKKNGFLFDNLAQLAELTLKMIDDKKREIVSKKAIQRAFIFNIDSFYQKLHEITK